MKRVLAFGVTLGLLGMVSLVGAATGSDYAMRVVPAASEVPEAGGTVDLTVQIETKVDETQGWSFGVLLEADPGVQASITRVAIAADTLTAKDGDPADFRTTSYYAPGDLANKVADCEPECTGIEAVGVSQGVVIDMMMAVTLPMAPEGFDMVDLTVEASGPADGSAARLNFTNELGTPPIETVAVHSGDSIHPDTLEGAVITFKEITQALPAAYTIEIQGGQGDTGEEVPGLIILDFNADGTQEGAQIQGWSYGVCIQDPAKLGVVDAVIDGTDTAGAKDGAPPDFNNINTYPEGVTHGVVIDMMSQVTIPAQNDWSDLAVTWQILMDQEGDSVFVTPCHETLGTPPVANVMVIGGQSIPASTFEGTDPTDPDTGCVDLEVCNKPGEFLFVPPPPGNFFIPGSANGDGRLDIADGVYILNALFRGGPPFPCEKAADTNNDCTVDASDAVHIIYYQFQVGDPPPPPPVLGLGCQLVGADVCPNLTCEVDECQGEAP